MQATRLQCYLCQNYMMPNISSCRDIKNTWDVRAIWHDVRRGWATPNRCAMLMPLCKGIHGHHPANNTWTLRMNHRRKIPLMKLCPFPTHGECSSHGCGFDTGGRWLRFQYSVSLLRLICGRVAPPGWYYLFLDSICCHNSRRRKKSSFTTPWFIMFNNSVWTAFTAVW